MDVIYLKLEDYVLGLNAIQKFSMAYFEVDWGQIPMPKNSFYYLSHIIIRVDKNVYTRLIHTDQWMKLTKLNPDIEFDISPEYDIDGNKIKEITHITEKVSADDVLRDPEITPEFQKKILYNIHIINGTFSEIRKQLGIE